MTYISGFLVPVPTAKKDAYRTMVEQTAGFFRECGAIELVEGWGADVPDGQVTDFRRAVQATADETVVFSWIIWPDKATADACAERMPTDARMQPPAEMPFDGRRMVFGGFDPLFEQRGWPGSESSDPSA